MPAKRRNKRACESGWRRRRGERARAAGRAGVTAHAFTWHPLEDLHDPLRVKDLVHADNVLVLELDVERRRVRDRHAPRRRQLRAVEGLHHHQLAREAVPDRVHLRAGPLGGVQWAQDGVVVGDAPAVAGATLLRRGASALARV